MGRAGGAFTGTVRPNQHVPLSAIGPLRARGDHGRRMSGWPCGLANQPALTRAERTNTTLGLQRWGGNPHGPPPATATASGHKYYVAHITRSVPTALGIPSRPGSSRHLQAGRRL